MSPLGQTWSLPSEPSVSWWELMSSQIHTFGAGAEELHWLNCNSRNAGVVAPLCSPAIPRTWSRSGEPESQQLTDDHLVSSSSTRNSTRKIARSGEPMLRPRGCFCVKSTSEQVASACRFLWTTLVPLFSGQLQKRLAARELLRLPAGKKG